jgi:hypothetical protein
LHDEARKEPGRTWSPDASRGSFFGLPLLKKWVAIAKRSRRIRDVSDAAGVRVSLLAFGKSPRRTARVGPLLQKGGRWCLAPMSDTCFAQNHAALRHQRMRNTVDAGDRAERAGDSPSRHAQSMPARIEYPIPRGNSCRPRKCDPNRSPHRVRLLAWKPLHRCRCSETALRVRLGRPTGACRPGDIRRQANHKE